MRRLVLAAVSLFFPDPGNKREKPKLKEMKLQKKRIVTNKKKFSCSGRHSRRKNLERSLSFIY
jgi:hypothetical protein